MVAPYRGAWRIGKWGQMGTNFFETGLFSMLSIGYCELEGVYLGSNAVLLRNYGVKTGGVARRGAARHDPGKIGRAHV